jgi:hypothetical protein
MASYGQHVDGRYVACHPGSRLVGPEHICAVVGGRQFGHVCSVSCRCSCAMVDSARHLLHSRSGHRLGYGGVEIMRTAFAERQGQVVSQQVGLQLLPLYYALNWHSC